MRVEFGTAAFDLRGPLGNQQMGGFRLQPVRQADSHPLLAHGKKLSVGTLHRHRVGQVHQMNDDGVPVSPRGHVENAGSGDFDHRAFVRGPFDGVAEKFEMVHRKHFPECAVDVPGKIGDAAGGFPQIHAGDVGFRLTRVHLFHRQVGVARNQRQRRRGKLVTRLDFQARNAVDDSGSVLQSLKQRVVRRRFMFQTKIGVPHRPLGRGRSMSRRTGPPGRSPCGGRPSHRRDWFRRWRSRRRRFRRMRGAGRIVRH